MELKNTNDRNISLDFIKILGIMSIIMVYVSEVFLKKYNAPSLEFISGNIFNALSRIGFPFFIMASGAIMLDEEKAVTLKSIFTKNIRNVICLFVFWSLLYACLSSIILPVINGKSIFIKSFILSTIKGYHHMWYLYVMIGLYLITPFLRAFVRKENKNLVLLFIALAVVTYFSAPVLNGLVRVSNKFIYIKSFINRFNITYFGGYTAYYLMGWYLVHVGAEKKYQKLGIYVAGAISLIISIIYVYLTKDFNTGYVSANFFMFVYISSTFMFAYSIKICDKSAKLISHISKYTFGMYIMFPVYLILIRALVPYDEMPVLHYICGFAGTFAMSYITSFIASKIPYIRKLIHM